MYNEVSESFESYFGGLKDQRIERHKLYSLTEILFVVLCGTICGAESWRDYVLFGKEKLDFLRLHFPFENGIPSKNTLSRVFYALDPEAFKQCFIEWVKSLQSLLNDVVAIDGKTLCNSINMQDNIPAIHMVSAFATHARLILAQQKVDDKSNEITAIPKLLDLLDLIGQAVTIDAIGTQKAIAKKIREKEADYVLALKGNQGTLNDDVRLFLEREFQKSASTAIEDRYEEVDKGHGRIEVRKCIVSSQIDWLQQKQDWIGLKTVAMIEETREVGDKISIERRFFISSLPADAKRIAAAVRAHWLIENALHWTLDVVFNEDSSRIRKDHAGENMAIVRHIVVNMLSNAKKLFKNIGLKALRKKASWGNETLGQILKQNF
ncbi:MAG: ISAs1 family transposase [Gammaproteobacteria bacterium]|nr:ISAs1 family transposase [Gammaproteobacteria bacterium]